MSDTFVVATFRNYIFFSRLFICGHMSGAKAKVAFKFLYSPAVGYGWRFVVIVVRCICELLTVVIHSFTYVDMTDF